MTVAIALPRTSDSKKRRIPKDGCRATLVSAFRVGSVISSMTHFVRHWLLVPVHSHSASRCTRATIGRSNQCHCCATQCYCPSDHRPSRSALSMRCNLGPYIARFEVSKLCLLADNGMPVRKQSRVAEVKNNLQGKKMTSRTTTQVNHHSPEYSHQQGVLR